MKGKFVTTLRIEMNIPNNFNLENLPEGITKDDILKKITEDMINAIKDNIHPQDGELKVTGDSIEVKVV